MTVGDVGRDRRLQHETTHIRGDVGRHVVPASHVLHDRRNLGHGNATVGVQSTHDFVGQRVATTELHFTPVLAGQADCGPTAERAAVLRGAAVVHVEPTFKAEVGGQAVTQIFRTLEAEART